jgi:hypothetical protein
MMMGNILATVTEPPKGRSMNLSIERTIASATISADSTRRLAPFVGELLNIKKPPVDMEGTLKNASLRRHYPVQVMRVKK